jgi:glycosyltransferase involved in cell wall biosynthesis
MKIGFVTPWYGDNIPGGAEAELRGIVKHLQGKAEVEVLTTCVEKFGSDWNKDFHKEGLTEEGGVKVRRFKVRKRDAKAFDDVNYKLMKGLHLNDEEAKIFVDEMINSDDLYAYMAEHKDEYDFFAYIPYMFGTTYNGISTVPEKSVLIPCLHHESYIYLKPFKEAFPTIAGMIFLSDPEKELAERVYDLTGVDDRTLGAGVNTEFTSDAQRFRDKFGIKDKFILYAGRKDSGKGVDVLIKYFAQYKARKQTDLKLVLIGGGTIDIPKAVKDDVIDLGFVDAQDKYDAYAAAELFCQPSFYESFSIVIMESWLAKRPVIVNGRCAVTRNFASKSNGGLWFENYPEFEETVSFIMEHEDIANTMGENGRQFVLDNFAWDVITKKYLDFFEGLRR